MASHAHRFGSSCSVSAMEPPQRKKSVQTEIIIVGDPFTHSTNIQELHGLAAGLPSSSSSSTAITGDHQADPEEPVVVEPDQEVEAR